jgi:nicotinate-nucleotide adenylyltransferase
MADQRPLAVLGGTFDPIHNGHLRFAEEVATALSLDEVRLVPAGQPPHRSAPLVSAEHRLVMAHLATSGNPLLRVDGREVQRKEPSYSVITLEEIRAEIGERPLCLLVGADAFFGLPFWHRWEELFKLAHIVVASRPGYELTSTLPLGLHKVWEQSFTDNVADLAARPAGLIYHQKITSLDIAANRIRSLVQHGRSARYLLPDTVLEYIHKCGLYR